MSSSAKAELAIVPKFSNSDGRHGIRLKTWWLIASTIAFGTAAGRY
jgi:hypothetical protein